MYEYVWIWINIYIIRMVAALQQGSLQPGSLRFRRLHGLGVAQDRRHGLPGSLGIPAALALPQKQWLAGKSLDWKLRFRTRNIIDVYDPFSMPWLMKPECKHIQSTSKHGLSQIACSWRDSHFASWWICNLDFNTLFYPCLLHSTCFHCFSVIIVYVCMYVCIYIYVY